MTYALMFEELPSRGDARYCVTDRVFRHLQREENLTPAEKRRWRRAIRAKGWHRDPRPRLTKAQVETAKAETLQSALADERAYQEERQALWMVVYPDRPYEATWGTGPMHVSIQELRSQAAWKRSG